MQKIRRLHFMYYLLAILFSPVAVVLKATPKKKKRRW